MDMRQKPNLLQAYGVIWHKAVTFQIKSPQGPFMVAYPLAPLQKINGSIEFLDPENLGMETKIRFLLQLLAKLVSLKPLQA